MVSPRLQLCENLGLLIEVDRDRTSRTSEHWRDHQIAITSVQPAPLPPERLCTLDHTASLTERRSKPRQRSLTAAKCNSLAPSTRVICWPWSPRCFPTECSPSS